MKYFILVLFLGISHSLCSQDSLTTEEIRSYSYHFKIDDGKMLGDGAVFLQKEFENSQFVVLGEYHGDAQISNFTNAILPVLSKLNFKYFGVEIGPHSAEMLMNLCKENPTETEMILHRFYTTQYQLSKSVAIPFFSNVEDARFLTTALDNDFELFGIDQEGYDAAYFLFDELLRQNKPSVADGIAKDAYQKLMDENAKDLKKDDHPFHEHLLQSKEIELFFSAMDKKNKKVQDIISALKKTWRIFADYGIRRYDNLQGRADYMKTQFARKYKECQEEQLLPKMLLKMGAMHSRKGFTSNNVFDMGNMIEELANVNQTQDLNIAFEFRYFLEDGVYEDNLDGNSKWTNEMKPLLSLGEKEKWTIIDMRELKRIWLNERKIIPREILRRIVWNDLIIIPPASYDGTPNYDEN